MPGTLKNYYEILGVPRSANADQIRTAYRKLLLKFHPDKNIGDVYFEDWSKKINEAFEVLINPELRGEYDNVYEQTKKAWKQAAQSSERENDCATAEANVPGPTSVDEEIKKWAPLYISAKQTYIRAGRNLSDIELRLAARRRNFRPVILINGGIIVLTLIWGGISNLHLFEKKDSGAGVAVAPPPLPAPTGPLEAAADPKGVAVDLWMRVMTPKAYFFKAPGKNRMDQFLSRGNKFHAIRKQGNYYYGVFQSSVNESYKISGWINNEDVEPLTGSIVPDY